MSDIFAASCALGRLQEENDFDAFMALVRPGAVVIDVGANFGLYTAHAALYAGPEGHVFGFEPGPGAFAILQSNMARNGLEAGSTVVRAAVGAVDGRSRFRLAADSAFSGLRDTGRSKTVGHIDVDVIALDRFAPLAGRAADLIKIDTEGGEAGVLAGAHELLARSPEVIVMFEFSYKNLDDGARALLIAELEQLQSAGLAMFGRDHDRLARLQPKELVGPRSENLFLVRPDTAAHAALSAALVQPTAMPGVDQRVALDLLRLHAGQMTEYQRLCGRIAHLAATAQWSGSADDPNAALGALAGRLRALEEEVAASSGALAKARARCDELQQAHDVARQRLDTVITSRDNHRAASVKLTEEITRLRRQRDQQARRLEDLTAKAKALATPQSEL